MDRKSKTPLRWLAMSLLVAAAVGASGIAQAAPDPVKNPTKPQVKNVIVMISDGMGYNQKDAATLYQYGKTGTQIYESFPFQSAMSTYSVGSYDPALAWSNFDYVKSRPTDSAAAATAMSTGVKTYDAAIGVDLNGSPLKHGFQLAEEKGKATGVITSVEFSHATPAGFVAHNVSRNNYEAIAQEMLLNSATDVIMSAGHPWFTDSGMPRTAPSYRYVGGQSTWDGIVAGTVAIADADGDGVADPWALVQTRAEFQELMAGATPKRVAGVAQAATTLQQGRGGDRKAAPYVVPLNDNVPTLVEMTKAALNVLDNDPDGLALIIEGGAGDWAGHANQ